LKHSDVFTHARTEKEKAPAPAPAPDYNSSTNRYIYIVIIDNRHGFQLMYLYMDKQREFCLLNSRKYMTRRPMMMPERTDLAVGQNRRERR
jgi:hypothetical protein